MRLPSVSYEHSVSELVREMNISDDTANLMEATEYLQPVGSVSQGHRSHRLGSSPRSPDRSLSNLSTVSFLNIFLGVSVF